MWEVATGAGGCCSHLGGMGSARQGGCGEQSGIFISEDVWLALVRRQCDRSVMIGTPPCWGKCCLTSLIILKINKTPSTPWRAEGCMYEWAGVHGLGKERVEEGGREGGWNREGSSLLLTEGLIPYFWCTLVAFQGVMDLVPGWPHEKITVGNSFDLSWLGDTLKHWNCWGIL